MAKKVPFADLTRIHSPLKGEILERLSALIDKSAFVLGAEVEMFEKDFARYVGSRHCLGVNSGFDALKLALQALDIGPGDEVITTANTFIATAFAISQCGATPVLVDVEPDTYTMDPGLAEKAITRRTKAIIPVHLYGQPASMQPILEVARKHGLSVIEDCAQSHGAQYQGRTTGTLGRIGCFSFYPGKNLGAMGEGGAITTDDENLRERVRMLRDVGQKAKYQHELIGQNSRLHSFQAAVLNVKLPHLGAQTEERNRIARRYGELLGDVKQVQLPKVAPDRTHVFHLYIVATQDPSDRDALQKHMAAREVQTLIHYPVPIHFQKAYESLGKGPGSYPVTEKLASSILTLPLFCGMTDDEIQTVARAVREYFKC